MNSVYQQVLHRLVGHFTRAERTALHLLIQRIVVAAGGIEQVGLYKVLVTHGGGEVSSYTLALLRAAQLTIASRSPSTFQLRVATLRHAGVTQATLDTLNHGYGALFFHDDPRVELLLVENQEVYPFNPLRPASSTGKAVSQRTMLMVGHMTSGDIRATLCNDTYLSLADFYQRVTAWNGGVHALVSGDSPRKQGLYLAWLKKNAAVSGIDMPPGTPLSLIGLFARMQAWTDACYLDLYGEHHTATESPPSGAHRHLAYIGIADLLNGVDPSSAPLLTDFLGYKADPFGFHFSHTAYPNPLLMAHLQGLQAQCLRALAYEDGVEGFVQQAMDYMQRRQIPEHLIAEASSHDGRVLATTYAQAFFGLDESQLTCLLFSPFIHHGQRLEGYLRQCHPGMLVALPELHKALQGKPVADMLLQWVVDTSGLPLPLVQHLYHQRPRGNNRGAAAQGVCANRSLGQAQPHAFQLSGR